MKTVIRAVSWATYLFWIILFLFSGTAVYSAFQLAQGFRFGEPRTSTNGGALTTTLPIYINNIGLYDISNVNLTTQIRDASGAAISDSSTLVPLIPHGKNSSIMHNITLSADSLTSSELSNLLFVDNNLNVEASLELVYARVIPIVIWSNSSMPWGAPLYNLTLGHVLISGTRVTVPFSFENHSFFEVNGTMRLELLDNLDQVVGQGTTPPIYSPQGSGLYSSSLAVNVSGNPASIRTARLYFQTSIFDYGPVVIPLV